MGATKENSGRVPTFCSRTPVQSLQTTRGTSDPGQHPERDQQTVPRYVGLQPADGPGSPLPAGQPGLRLSLSDTISIKLNICLGYLTFIDLFNKF